MANAGQHRFLNGILIPKFCERVGVEPTQENVLQIKQMFKRYLHVASTSRLTDTEFSLFVRQVLMLIAREYGEYIPEGEHEPEDAANMDLLDFLRMKGYYI